MKILTFGEIMLRLKTPEHLRIINPKILKPAMEGRSQCCGISGNAGGYGFFLTKVPDNSGGMAALKENSWLWCQYRPCFERRKTSGHLLF